MLNFLKKKLPDTQEVAKRALCLYVLIMRGNFEQVVQNGRMMNLNKEAETALIDGHKELVSNFINWLSKEKLVDHQSREEKRLLSTPLGEWGYQAIINTSWRVQSLAVLLWSLSIIDKIPPYDQEVNDAQIIENFELKRGTKDFIDRARLRNKSEIEKTRDIAELWHWRARTTQLLQEGKMTLEQDVGGGLSLKEVIKLAAQKGHEAGDLPNPIDGDFALFGKAYRDLTLDEYRVARSIAMERHYSLNWLCGYARDWDDVPTDT